MDVPLEILRECGAALHPVAAIEVFDSLHGADFGAMDVSANHPLDPGLARDVDHSLFEAGDVADGGFRLEFQVGRHGPIAESKPSADPVEVEVELEDPVVKA